MLFRSAPQKKKLSYMEAREFESMEQKIAEREAALEQLRDSLNEVAMKEPLRLEQLYKDIETAQQEVDALYSRWAELEEKAG